MVHLGKSVKSGMCHPGFSQISNHFDNLNNFSSVEFRESGFGNQLSPDFSVSNTYMFIRDYENQYGYDWTPCCFD